MVIWTTKGEWYAKIWTEWRKVQRSEIRTKVTSYLVRYSMFRKHFQHKMNLVWESNLSEVLTMTNLEKQSRIIRYFWPRHPKLSMLRAYQGLVAAMSFIKGSELFLEACFMHAEHDISWVISLVMPGQKIDCLARSKVLFTPICAICSIARQLLQSLVGTTMWLPLSIKLSTTVSSSQ